MTQKGFKNGKSSAGKASGGSPAYKAGVTWFNPTLNSGDIKWLEDRGDQFLSDCFNFLLSVREHERVTLKYDVSTSRWLAILFLQPLADGEQVHAMSCRGSTATDALGVLAYCINVKFADGWLDASSEPSGRFG